MTPAETLVTAVGTIAPPRCSTAVRTAVEGRTAADRPHRGHPCIYQPEPTPADRGGPRCHRTPTAVPSSLRVTAVECSPLPIGEHDSTAVTNDGMTPHREHPPTKKEPTQ